MYPQNNYYYPPSQPTPNIPIYQQQYSAAPPVGLKGRPVSSYEEARAMTIDFDGSTFFFPDLANKRIYTKQINMDGTASLFVYELREKPIEQPTVVVGDFVTREEFDKVIKELRAAQVPTQPAAPVATAPAATAKVEQPKPVFNLF